MKTPYTACDGSTEQKVFRHGGKRFLDIDYTYVVSSGQYCPVLAERESDRLFNSWAVLHIENISTTTETESTVQI